MAGNLGMAGIIIHNSNVSHYEMVAYSIVHACDIYIYVYIYMSHSHKHTERSEINKMSTLC